MSEKTLIIGDVHGCSQELDILLQKAQLDDQTKLIFTGDLIAKGPDSHGVIQRCKQLGARAVRGNHEEHAIKWYTNDDSKRHVSTQNQAIYQTLTSDDWDYILSLPYFIIERDLLTDQDVFITHAGIDPSKPLLKQDKNILTSIRSIRKDKSPSKEIDGYPWAQDWKGPELIVFGHDALRGLQSYPYALGIDSGCVYGNKLTSVIFEHHTFRLISTQAIQPWTPIE